MVCSRPPGEIMQVLHKRAVIVLGALILMTISAGAQSEEKFKIRIAPVPLDGSMRTTVAGSGSAMAALSGNKLTITGTLEGMSRGATTARIHHRHATGVRRCPVPALTVTQAAK